MTFNSFNNHNRSKYHRDGDESNSSGEHYYQNNHSPAKKSGKKRKRRGSGSGGGLVPAKSSALNASNHSLYYHTHHGYVLGGGGASGIGLGLGLGSSSSGMASSTASSDRPLILRRKKFKVAYFLLILAVFFLALSLISIAISFIFPFWVSLSLIDVSRNSSSIIYNGTVTISNLQNNISLIVRNNTNSGGVDLMHPIVFDLGIWEVKMHEELAFMDAPTSKNTTSPLLSNHYPSTLLWLNLDSSMSIESFLIHLLAFVDLPSSAIIFVVQLLEIAHIVFTLVALCFTSFTLCLCTSSYSKSSLCWYLVSFFMCLIAFMSGLGVIVLIIVWQASNLPALANQFGDEYYLDRSFNWCFWLAVGIDSALLLASLLILLYILLRIILIYIRNRTIAKTNSTWSSHRYQRNDLRPSKLQTRTARLYHQNGSSGINIDDIDISHFSRLPRLPPSQQSGGALTSSRTNPVAVSSNIQERLMAQNQLILAAQQQQQHNQLNATIESMRSPSYIFYTGHGNYHKQEITLETPPPPPPPPLVDHRNDGMMDAKTNNYDVANEFIQPPNTATLVNYSFVAAAKSHLPHHHHMSHHHPGMAVATVGDHPYSNVVDQSEHRYNNFR